MDLVELRKLWVSIPDSLIIESYKLWNTEEIMTTYEEEQSTKLAESDWVEWLESSQAELENKKMMNWYPISVQEWENHEIHLAIHGAILNSVKDMPQIASLIMTHMQQHESLLANPQKIPKQVDNMSQNNNMQ